MTNWMTQYFFYLFNPFEIFRFIFKIIKEFVKYINTPNTHKKSNQRTDVTLNHLFHVSTYEV